MDKKYILSYFYLFFLLLIGGFLEFLSLTSLTPILFNLMNVTNAEINFSFEYFNFLFNYINKINLSLLLSIFISLNLLKNLYLIFINYYKEKLSLNLYQNLSSRLFLGYLNQDLKFYFKNNSTFLTNNIINEIRLFVKFIDSYITIILEIFIIALFFLVLISINFKTTFLVVCVLFFFLYLFKSLTKKFLISSSYNRQRTDYKLSLILNESFRNIKIIKLNNNNEYLYKLFSIDNKVWSNSILFNNFLNLIPKFLLEIYILFIIFFIFFYTSIFNFDKNELIVTGSFFLIASYRMLPSFNRITSCIQTIISATAVVSRLFIEFSITKKSSKSNLTSGNSLNFSNYIKVNDVSFAYNINKKIFNKVNLVIRKKSVFGILGKSGCGKSTLIDLIMGFLEPQSGEIFIDDVNIKNNLESWQKKIGYVSQRIFLNDDSIKNNIIFGYQNVNENNQLNKVIYQTQLNDLIVNKKISLDDKIGEQGIQLSGGQIQRIAIARALFRDPELLILDEATSGLDVESESQILEFVKNIKDITIIIISHRDSIRNYCDDIIELR